MQFECIADIRGEFLESPVWDDRRSAIFCCDVLGRCIYEVGLEGGIRRKWSFEAKVGSLGLCESGRLIVATGLEIILFDPETGARDRLAVPAEEPPGNRLNDGKVGPDGCFWVGSMDDGPHKMPVGSLYRIDAAGRCDRKASGFYVSNGLAWSHDDRTLFHSDSRGLWIDAYDFDPVAGHIGNRVRLLDLDATAGRPDGAACDTAGFYWSAGISAGVLNRISPQGAICERIGFPVSGPTMPCFCGPDLKTLVVTSHRCGEHPANRSGGLFAARSAVAGVRVGRMKGV
ncbi:MAG: SMP-30/gluconolactonase/LRE family protein [Rhizobiaceae bacterium]|nr:SMP-30/gluconolactonase/LRE family protein [Rhizobiaceae bacterium]